MTTSALTASFMLIAVQCAVAVNPRTRRQLGDISQFVGNTDPLMNALIGYPLNPAFGADSQSIERERIGANFGFIPASELTPAKNYGGSIGKSQPKNTGIGVALGSRYISPFGAPFKQEGGINFVDDVLDPRVLHQLARASVAKERYVIKQREFLEHLRPDAFGSDTAISVPGPVQQGTKPAVTNGAQPGIPLIVRPEPGDQQPNQDNLLARLTPSQKAKLEFIVLEKLAKEERLKRERQGLI